MVTTNQVGSNTIGQPHLNQLVEVVREVTVVITDQVVAVDISAAIHNNVVACVDHRGPHVRSTDRNTERRSENERTTEHSQNLIKLRLGIF